MACKNCIYKRFCRTKKGGAGATACNLFVPEPTKTELLEILRSAIVYRIVTMIDHHTCNKCLKAEGKLLNNKEAFEFIGHQEKTDTTEHVCRCVLIPVEYEDDGKRIPNSIH